VFLAVMKEPPSVLLAASEDAELDSEKRSWQPSLRRVQRRGRARIAQESVPAADALEQVAGRLLG
jgi:hypothetical protein